MDGRWIDVVYTQLVPLRAMVARPTTQCLLTSTQIRGTHSDGRIDRPVVVEAFPVDGARRLATERQREVSQRDASRWIDATDNGAHVGAVRLRPLPLERGEVLLSLLVCVSPTYTIACGPRRVPSHSRRNNKKGCNQRAYLGTMSAQPLILRFVLAGCGPTNNRQH